MRVRAIDLFCGAGGLTWGLQEAGIEVISGYDFNPLCAYPYAENTGARFVECDLSTPDMDRMSADLDTHGPTLIAGCAPCQRFSTYDRLRRGSGDAWPLLDAFGSVVTTVRPDYVTMENVPGLARDPAFARFHGALTAAGYQVTYDVLDCRRYGVPQARKRLVLIASLHGFVGLPDPTHEEDDPSVSVRSRIAGLPSLAPGEADSIDRLHAAARMSDINLERIRASRPGGTWLDWPEHLRAPCHRKASGVKFMSVYGRMEWDRSAPTITGQANGFGNGRFGHPEQDRAITLREAALLQTFPPGYKFVDPKDPMRLRQIGEMIGNAVPPKLGAAIGSRIVAHAASVWRTNGIEPNMCPTI